MRPEEKHKMNETFFCEILATAGTAAVEPLAVILILGLFALWFAAYCRERGIWAGMRRTWASMTRPASALMAALCVFCTLNAQKSMQQMGGGDGNAAPSGALIAIVPGGMATIAASDGTGFAQPSALHPQALAAGEHIAPDGRAPLSEGTNNWWGAEGRDATDTDGDGMPDEWERLFGLDPRDPADALLDHDRDGLVALEEFLNRTHPRRRDTDGDGMPDACEAARFPLLCPWFPDDTLDADGDGLDNFHEYALGSDPGTPDTNGDGRPDGGEAAEGVPPALTPPGWAAYGTGSIAVSVDGLRAARRAGVVIGHVTHSGVPQRVYRLAAGTRYPLSVIDLDPGNTNACSGTVRIETDGGTFIRGFTNEFAVAFPLDPAAPPCPPGANVTVVGIDIEVPYPVWTAPDNSAMFLATARFVPFDEELPGGLEWSANGGTLAPAPGPMSVWVTMQFTNAPPALPPQGAPALLALAAPCACEDTPCLNSQCPCGCVRCGQERDSGGSYAVKARAGGRAAAKNVYPPERPDPSAPPGEAPPDPVQRFIARSDKPYEQSLRTYALACSSNTASFKWHGESGDTVNWEIQGAARFLVDGREQAKVMRAQSVEVLPGDNVSTSYIFAQCKTPKGHTSTAFTEFRAVTIAAEPVMSFTGGQMVNPSGLFDGGAATFHADFSGNVILDDVRWSAANGHVGVAAVSGSPSQRVVGLSPGTDTLTVDIDNYVGSPPEFNITVYAPEPPIPVHFMFVCTNGHHVGSASDIPALIAGANDVYRQAGLRFACASVSYTNQPFWFLNSEMAYYQQEIVNAMTGTHGLEVYIVPNIAPGVPGRNLPKRGLLMTTTTSAHIFAHEIGHECGWHDIYTSPGKDLPQMTTLLSREHLPSDWNNGSGPQEYYPRDTQLATVIRRCLMFGLTSGGSDIPTGSIHGFDKFGVFGPIPVGTSGMTRPPQHDQ